MTKPLVTFALLTFNQERFVAAALDSALAQTYEPLEILICDDRSSDGTLSIIAAALAAYRGPHRLRLHRNVENLGCIRNTLSALALAQSDLVVFGAGDDISEPGRVEEIQRVADRHGPSAYSFWSAARLIDEAGQITGDYGYADKPPTTAAAMAELAWTPCGATLACRKSVGAAFGPVDPVGSHEDLVLHFRAALLGDVIGIARPLVRWRRHPGSMDSASALFDRIETSEFVNASRKAVLVRLHCLRQRRRDLQHAIERWPERRAQLTALIPAADRAVRDYESLQLMTATGLGANLRGVVMAIWTGHGAREIVKRLFRLRFPALWQRYMRWRAAQAPRR